MIQIEDKILSQDIFDKHFLCDLPKCKGSCCVEGESGAPLEDEETEILEKIYPKIKHLLPEASHKIIEEQGTWVVDMDGDKVTPINNGRECVYVYFEEDGTAKCGIEKAYNQGIIDFKKPISCHLYPIRVTKYKDFEALNYHQWPICEPARVLGKEVGLPIFKFLKEPLIRKYGEEFYGHLEEVDKVLKEEGNQ